METSGTDAPRRVAGLLGTKLGMTQVWDDENRLVPVTVIQAGPCVVTQVRDAETDGYQAVQIAYGAIDPRKVNKPESGHFAKAGVTPRRYTVELRTADAGDYSLGQELTVELFEAGGQVDVSATTKGKGFAGVMKRHGFAGVSASHGAHRNHRKPGSIGGCATPGRVFRGTRMAGRMGGERQTTQNLTIHAVDAERGLVITNHHVIEGAENVSVQLADGRALKATFVGSDPQTDIAVMRIPTGGLQALPLGDSQALRVGDFVVAVGNPFGIGQTVTSGIVSAVGRTGIPGAGYQNFIQTDAAINPDILNGDRSVDKHLVGVPDQIASLWLNYRLPSSSPVPGLSVGGGVRYVGSTYATGTNVWGATEGPYEGRAAKVDSFTLVDLAVGYDFGAQDPSLAGLRANLNVTNLFDKDYVAACNGYGTCSFGAERRVLLTLAYSW